MVETTLGCQLYTRDRVYDVKKKAKTKTLDDTLNLMCDVYEMVHAGKMGDFGKIPAIMQSALEDLRVTGGEVIMEIQMRRIIQELDKYAREHKIKIR